MNTRLTTVMLLMVGSALAVLGAQTGSAPLVYHTGGLVPSSPEVASGVKVAVEGSAFAFTVEDARAYTLRLRVLDHDGNVVWASGLSGANPLVWAAPSYAGAGEFYY